MVDGSLAKMARLLIEERKEELKNRVLARVEQRLARLDSVIDGELSSTAKDTIRIGLEMIQKRTSDMVYSLSDRIWRTMEKESSKSG